MKDEVKALSHDVTCENIDIWNCGTKSADDIPSKLWDPMKLERRRHLEHANTSHGLPQPMSAPMWTSTQC